MDLHIPVSASLKAKRAAIRPILDSSRARFGVAAAEVDFHEQWQRTRLGFAAVAGSPGHVEDVLDAVVRFVWSRPDVEVLSVERRWLE
jgi:uncharacterized protein YlxP (DUF503 family)